jgi:hypothetical protein
VIVIVSEGGKTVEWRVPQRIGENHCGCVVVFPHGNLNSGRMDRCALRKGDAGEDDVNVVSHCAACVRREMGDPKQVTAWDA